MVVSICVDKKWAVPGQGRAGQGRHPPTGPAGGPQQQPVDLWPHLDQPDGCVSLSVTGPGEVPRPVWPAHRALCTPVWPAERTYKAKRAGGGRGPFLNCKTPLFQGIAHSALFIAQ
jgi:hypothetical protein